MAARSSAEVVQPIVGSDSVGDVSGVGATLHGEYPVFGIILIFLFFSLFFFLFLSYFVYLQFYGLN